MMKQLYTITAILLCLTMAVNGQDEELKYLNVNEVYTTINPQGGLFWDGLSESTYTVPYTCQGNGAQATFAANSWMAMRDDVENLYGSMVRYAHNGELLHRTPGMLDQATGLPFVDDPLAEGRVYSVSRLEIESLLEDLEDGTVDNIIPADILEWPARGNQSFQGMLDNQNAAPFVDQNGDGLYDPSDGDYPFIGGNPTDRIPDQLLYQIENDSSSDSGAGIELHSMIYAYYCEDNPSINQSVYQRHLVYNRSNQNYNNFYFGHWIDYDLGCSEDDAVGCDSLSNIMYVYNADDKDGNASSSCTTGVKSYSNSVFNGRKILNGNLESCLFTNSSFAATNDIFEYSQLASLSEMLIGKWADGTPVTPDGNGYNPNDITGPTTKFHYHDNPNNSNAWKSESEDHRGLGTQYASQLPSGGMLVFDLVNTFAESNTLDHLQVINLGIDRLNEAALFYDSGFDTECLNPLECGSIDCIYPGDVNNDEQVSAHDYMLGAKAVSVDNISESPRHFISDVWRSFDGDDRSQMFNSGVNYKNADCNGDGKVNDADLDVVSKNFAKETEYYDAVNSLCPPYQGSGLIELDLPSELTTQSQGTNISKLNISDFDGIYGITYTLMYDRTILKSGFTDFSVLPSQVFDDGGFLMYSIIPGEEVYIFASSSGEESTITEAGSILKIDFEEGINVSSTVVRLSNIMVMDYDENFYCLDDVVHTIDFTDISSTKELEDDTSVTLYPNPTSSQVTIASESQMSSFTLRNLEGKFIQTGTMHGIQQTLDLDLAGGVYLLQVLLENGAIWNERIVIVE